MAYFDLDINPIIDHCKQRGDIKHVRFPVRDFDPFSLRQRLPEAVATLVKAAASGRGKLYIHCTAGDTCSGPTLVYQYRTCFRQMLCPMVYIVTASMISIQSQLGASILYIHTCIQYILYMTGQVLLGTSVLHAQHTMQKTWYVHSTFGQLYQETLWYCSIE